MSTSDRERLKQLERENRELKRPNEILRKASAYFAQADLEPTEMTEVFVNQHKKQYGVGPICRQFRLPRQTTIGTKRVNGILIGCQIALCETKRLNAIYSAYGKQLQSLWRKQNMATTVARKYSCCALYRRTVDEEAWDTRHPARQEVVNNRAKMYQITR
ncbi:hypothetical protein C8R11_11296 [Nitrosomonas aestuarii]|nr:hypothetical protein C8R11_11296 [Nitrosomonas aestuarii]